MTGKNMEADNLRAMMNAPEIDIDPMQEAVRELMNDIAENEFQFIEDILRHHIDHPIDGELTYEKVKAAGIRGIAYARDCPKAGFENREQNVVLTMTSTLLGVVQGDLIIGAGGVRRTLTDEERKSFNEQDRLEQMLLPQFEVAKQCHE